MGNWIVENEPLAFRIFLGFIFIVAMAINLFLYFGMKKGLKQ